MVRETTLKVQTDTRDRVDAFKRATGCSSNDEAVTELLRIAADEGYWDGETGATVASAKQVEALGEKHNDLLDKMSMLRDRITALEEDR